MQPREDDASAGPARGDLVDLRDGTFHAPVVGVQNNHAGPRTPKPWPHQVGTIPPEAVCFQDRAERARLTAALALDGAVMDAPTARAGVVVGLGGVGKTQLAAHYARSIWRSGQLDVLVWITAGNREAVVRGYAAAGADLLGVDPADPDGAAAAFLAWLEPKAGQKVCRWLVVLDDVSDPADLNGRWPPACPTGRVLVTSRRQDAALITGRHQILVGVFTPAESLAYLTHALPPSEPHDELAALAEDLGHLPLALSQAAAYLTDTGTRAADYRRLLASHTTHLCDAAPDTLPDGQQRAVAVTWALSIEHADRLRPAGLARPLLQLAAFLDGNGIPDTVLTSTPARNYLALHRGSSAPQEQADEAQGRREVPERDVRVALSVLRRLSLIQHTRTTPHTAVRVHQLVQRATRDSLSADACRHMAHVVADALMDAWPESELDTRLAQAMRANTGALANLVEGAALYTDGVHRVLYRAGRSLGESGQFNAAVDHFRTVHEKADEHLGADHPDTMAARNNLASWRGESGDAAGAADAFADLVSDRRRVQGADHPDTLAARHNLAHCRGEAGDAAGAVEAFASLVSDRRRVQGADHPDTLAARHNLARWRGESGHTAKAAAALAELVAVQVRVQGAEHPNTLAVKHSLARWRGELGNAVGAAEALTELLTVQLRVQGAEHLNTLAVKHSLARWRGEAGDAVGAAEALTELLADQLRAQSPTHPNTLAVRHSLARWRGEAGDAAGAAEAFAALVSDRRRVQGPDHRDTLAARHNLAHWRGEAGDAAGAAEAFAALVSDRQRVQGPDHPDTLLSRREVLAWRDRARIDPVPKAADRSTIRRWAARLWRKRPARP
ncbi:tetratricopeptide repeat protein [Streptomyces sp. NPDC008086]|uniref:tetratricopeptide repeat protein n=1 Tax=Streptomyces sp. NPDC008086 TaxID=3364807 RepID=UPI0036E47724